LQTKHLRSWRSFEEQLNNLQGVSVFDGLPGTNYLFRGQSNADWDLITTLERHYPDWTWRRYLRAVRSVAPTIETMTNRHWDLPPYAETTEWGSSFDDGLQMIPGYDFWVYLRHHGFPSPLLDWSRSPYVAAFFAFRYPSAKRVSIFCYQETPTGGKSSGSNRPVIHTHGPFVRSHPRHVLQQGEYTTCSTLEGGQWQYTKHSDVFALNDPDQDRLWKFTLPATERAAVLKHLNKYNLNAYSLFATEEALLETLALDHMARDL